MFDPYAHRKRLLAHFDPARMQPAERIAGTVADGKNDNLTRNIFCRTHVLADNSTYPAVLHVQILHQRAEPHLTAKAFDLLADIFYNDPQHVGTDMRFLLM